MLPHPLYRKLETEDGFPIFLDMVSGDLSPEMPAQVHDFQGGLFCDEPGLGKTVTALSLILKTQGAVAEPPPGTQVCWGEHRSGEKVGHYVVRANGTPLGASVVKRSMMLKARRQQGRGWESCREALHHQPDCEHNSRSEPLADILCSRSLSPSLESELSTMQQVPSSTESQGNPSLDCWVENSLTPLGLSPSPVLTSDLLTSTNSRLTRSSARLKRKLSVSFEESSKPVGESCLDEGLTSSARDRGTQRLRLMSTNCRHLSVALSSTSQQEVQFKPPEEGVIVQEEACMSEEEVWVQCDACRKWRKLPNDAVPPREGLAWFCSMNKDSLYQSCTTPEQICDHNTWVRSLPGFYKRGTAPGQKQNVSFFMNVIKENAHLLDVHAKPVWWLANLNSDKLCKLAAGGLTIPRDMKGVGSADDAHSCESLFKTFGLIQSSVGKGVVKWQYPSGLDNLVFDSLALRQALLKPVDDAIRIYLSKATLIVVPSNLVEHWKNQIAKHTTPGQLRVYIWTDHKKPPLAHSLAWDHDIVITTFNRLSSEWSARESTVLMRVHWLRVILDEGHTLGASLSLTNKLQMAVSMHACRRWLLTGTPTPNTPNSQVAHLQPMLKFLHEGIYGKQQKIWETAILRPFEAGREEGRERLLQLLHRVMISSRKADLCTIPPCIRKVKLLDFTEQHAASYNELVVTVQRNILLADWKDPSHVESLLNSKQWKARGIALRNARLSCCVAGHIKMQNAGEDVLETMEVFVREQGMDPLSHQFDVIQNALLYGGNCNR